ncbi:MAG TPA: DNA polymerase III subunit gamma/tau [Candidatus Saccharimonadales bacterium]
MGQALYRSHRPKKLSEVVGQEHVTTALDRALKKGTISHAYLLTGPRGVGKTTIARILAHEINNLPYEDNANHLDIVEIDAASNRRIDEIRELRDKVHIAPTSAKYKVYIIDEVHMLTKEAFNALLKTLEEPPAHAIFILATTEVHKLPETIISRTQRYAFKPVDRAKVTQHLKHIADLEKIVVDEQALDLIAEHGEGSFRDSISLLDQVRNSGDKVTLADVQATLGIAPKELIASLLDAVAAQDAPLLITHLQTAHAGGHEPARMAKQLGEALRTQLLGGNASLSNDLLLLLLSKLIEVPSSGDPRSALEITLLDAALAGTKSQAQVTPAIAKMEKVEIEKPKPPKIMTEEVQAKPAVQVDPHPAIARKRAAQTPDPAEDESQAPTSTETLDEAAWPAILAAIKSKHNTIYSVVRTARPHFAPGAITLECGYVFHQKKLNEKSSKKMLADIIQEVTGHGVRIDCTVGTAIDPSEVPKAPPQLPPADEIVHTVAAPKPAAEDIKAISNIFGGAEVLES